jgi:enoyl-CoA hydratase/carnithine racemase
VNFLRNAWEILRVQFNRPAKKNAMTLAIYTGLANLLNEADKDEYGQCRSVVRRRRLFYRRQRLENFVKNPPGPGDSSQGRLIGAPIDFSTPLVAALHGVAIGGGTTILTCFDFVYAAEIRSSSFHLSISGP